MEPFLGGGALFFGLEPERALLSDINPELINLYEVIRDNPRGLRHILEWHQAKHSSSHYYASRARRYRSCTWRAARTLYLNRTCWNGLYRLNRRGDFNVPIGTKTAVIMLNDDFEACSKALQKADISCQDFEQTISQAGKGDFLFVDPPYTVKHNLNGFLKYNETIFRWDDQVRLVAELRAAAGRGAAVLVTNADHDSVRSLYHGLFEYRRIERQSVLSGSASGRGTTSEAIFTVNL